MQHPADTYNKQSENMTYTLHRGQKYFIRIPKGAANMNITL